jgi:hypothetical protein
MEVKKVVLEADMTLIERDKMESTPHIFQDGLDLGFYPDTPTEGMFKITDMKFEPMKAPAGEIFHIDYKLQYPLDKLTVKLRLNEDAQDYTLIDKDGQERTPPDIYWTAEK